MSMSGITPQLGLPQLASPLAQRPLLPGATAVPATAQFGFMPADGARSGFSSIGQTLGNLLGNARQALGFGDPQADALALAQRNALLAAPASTLPLIPKPAAKPAAHKPAKPGAKPAKPKPKPAAAPKPVRVTGDAGVPAQPALAQQAIAQPAMGAATMGMVPAAASFNPLGGLGTLGMGYGMGAGLPAAPDNGPQVNATSQGAISGVNGAAAPGLAVGPAGAPPAAATAATGGNPGTQHVENRNTFDNSGLSTQPALGYGGIGWGGVGSPYAGWGSSYGPSMSGYGGGISGFFRGLLGG